MVQAAQEIAQARSPSPVARIRRSRSQSRPTHSGLRSDEQTASQDTIVSVAAGPTGCITETLSPPTDETMPLLSSDNSSAVSVPHSLHGDSPKGGHSHGHGGSMNMRALVLHVLGDALGNVGVIATGLVIWKTTWAFKYYFDPMISLVITIIIFSSALPLGAYGFSSSTLVLKITPANFVPFYS